MNSLILTNIHKSFYNKTILKNINLVFKQGEIYALLGENGSGKTTLASIIYGRIQPDFGSICIQHTFGNSVFNKKLILNSPKSAIDNGIAYVYQEPFVSEENTCLENIFLNSFKESFFFNRKMLQHRAEQLMHKFEIKLDLSKKGWNLTAQEKFNVAFLSALVNFPQVLILDEPCASLSNNEKENLFVQLQKLKNEGCIIIFITHNKNEALKYATKHVFLQKGKESLIEENAIQKLNSMLCVDENLLLTQNSSILQNNIDSSKPFFSVSNLSAKETEISKINDFSFGVYSGKLTFVKGTQETGLLLLENIISGMYNRNYCGKIILNQNEYKTLTPKILRQNFVSIVPSNKMLRGAPQSLTINELLFTKMTKSKSNLQIIADSNLDVKLDDKVSTLSGGMLQRLIIERELSLNPKLVIFANPFYGLDIPTTETLIKRIVSLLQDGIAILVLSVDDNLLESRSDFFLMLNPDIDNQKN